MLDASGVYSLIIDYSLFAARFAAEDPIWPKNQSFVQESSDQFGRFNYMHLKTILFRALLKMALLQSGTTDWLSLLPDVPRLVIEPAGITVLLVAGIIPAMVRGDNSQLRDAIPSLSTIVGVPT